jgi:opacity protein-like surface antigen
MGAKLLAAVAVLLVSISCFAQVQPAAGKGKEILPPIRWSAGAGMDYMSGDWGKGDINRWGPAAWVTATMWHCLGINVEGHSMILGGNSLASNYKLFVGEGGVMCTMGYWGRFQPIYKGEMGFASLSQPGNGSGRFHSNYWTWSVGGGVEYHIRGHWWTRVDYTYEAIPDFYNGYTKQYHTLNPRGIAFGATYRFGAAGTRF